MSERLYEIVAQRPTTIITGTNRVLDGIELHVEAPGDISFIVKVPAEATPELIDRTIRERLQHALNVAGLGNG